MAAPDWLPDWKDAAAYPGSEDLAPVFWAWQFLRRNPEYQRKWSELQKHTPFEKKAQWVALTAPIEREFDIVHVTDPANDRPYAMGIGWWPVPYPRIDHAGEGLTPSTEDSLVVEFDLGQPLDAQLEEAKSEMQRIRSERKEDMQSIRDEWKARGLADPLGEMPLFPKGTRHQWKIYPYYLRVLDADAVGASLSDIVAILLPDIEDSYPNYAGKKHMRNNLNAARALRDGGYRNIARK